MTEYKKTFKTWAIGYYKENPIKTLWIDFINDMDHDTHFPKSGNKHHILKYLRKCGACDHAIEGFDIVWNEFEKLNVNN